MIIPIVGASALEFWLSGVSAFPPNQFSVQNRKLVSLPEEYFVDYQEENYRAISSQYGLSLPIQIMVNKDADRKSGNCFHIRMRPKKLPDKSFVRLNKDIYISSPELCFIQVAKVLPLPKLVEAANDFCAMYSLNPNAALQQIARDPIVSTQNILSFLEQTKGLAGIKKARQAIAYAVDASFSPKESELAALASIRLSQGGYGMPKPGLNRDILLSEDAAKILGRNTCCCDLVWEKQRVIVEYDSNLTHLSVNQHAYDKRKTNALNMSGYKVFYVTAENMSSFKSIEATFSNLRKMLGLRPMKSTMEKYESIRREAVHAIVFTPWREYIKE